MQHLSSGWASRCCRRDARARTHTFFPFRSRDLPSFRCRFNVAASSAYVQLANRCYPVVSPCLGYVCHTETSRRSQPCVCVCVSRGVRRCDAGVAWQLLVRPVRLRAARGARFRAGHAARDARPHARRVLGRCDPPRLSELGAPWIPVGRRVSSRGVCCLSPGEIHADLMRRYAPAPQAAGTYGALSLQDP